jgi:KaiC/GvpD/RAD55 family RecA-like ATPase
MSATLRLPTELTNFSLREPARSLLIRGAPGTGKTTLALTMLSAFSGQRVFVTSRVYRTELERDYDWLAPEVPSLQVIESSRDGDRVRDREPVLERAHELIDFRPGGELVDKLWLPEALTDAYSRMKAGESGMVVVDSWDALVERYLGVTQAEAARLPDREEIERLLIGLMGRGQVHLVLVVEREGQTQLDYLVDGVVLCNTLNDGNRLERWLHLKKMRGVRVEHPSYPFTLDGGRFQCIAPLQSRMELNLPQPDPEPDARPGWIWSGSNQFDAQFGRLPIGRLTLIETDLDVPAEAVVLFCSPIVSQVARQGGRAFHVLPPRASPETVYLAYRHMLTPDQFVERVRIFSSLGGPIRGPHAQILGKVMLPGFSPTAQGTESRMPEAIRFLQEESTPAHPSLSFVWLTGLEHAGATASNPYTPQNLPAILQHTVEAGNVHAILVSFASDPFLVGLREMATLKIEMQSKHGRIFVYGRTPVTPPLVLASSEEMPYQLIRIV